MESKFPFKTSESNLKMDEKMVAKQQIKDKQRKTFFQMNPKDERIVVFKITKRDNSTLIKRSYLVDEAVTFPISMKASQVWVLKSL